MPNSNQDTQRKAGFFHSIGKVITEYGNIPGNENYKSAHNVRSTEVWMDEIPFAQFGSASQYSDGIIVRQIGSASGNYNDPLNQFDSPAYLYPLKQSNYQTWFLDTGTPSAYVDGFLPSDEWVKPLINPSDVPNSAGGPSEGYQFRMYRRDGTTLINYGSAYYDVDYFAGLIRFDKNFTPIDAPIDTQLGFQFSQSGFQAVLPVNDATRKAYIQSVTTGGPRAVAWQYVGQTLNEATFGASVSFGTSSTIGWTQSGPTYSFYIEQGSITASLLNTGSNGGATSGYYLSVDGDGNFSWQSLNVGSGTDSNVDFYNTDTIIFSTQSTINGIAASASIATASITTSLLATASNGGATAGYVLSNTGDGNFAWVPQSTGTQLDVVDYLTGETFSAVSTMIFRGGVVNVPPISSTATGVLVTGPAPAVTVWIPAPNYADYFSPTLFSSTTPRYVSEPTTNNYNYSSSPGEFGIGTWNTSSDFSATTTRNTINNSGTITLFSNSDFACFDTGTTMSFQLIKDDGSTIIQSIENLTINAIGSTNSGGLTLNITAFGPDNDRYKATANGTLAVGTEFTNGGRFKWKITHYNGEGLGNGPGAGIYSYTSGDIFFDNDESVTSASISDGVDFDELVYLSVQYSGVKFYTTGSTFALTASGIDLLNDISFPTTKQLDLSCTNMAISGYLNGYADGSQAGVGSSITGWTIDWNKSGLTFSQTATVNISGPWPTGLYIPGYTNTTTNLLDPSVQSSVTARLFDWGLQGSSQSVSRYMLFDTVTTGSVTYNNNPLDSETGRLHSFSVLSNGSSTFDSTQPIDVTDDLQYMFGRVIYPQEDLTQYYPTFNWSASLNYTSLTGSSRTFTVYNNLTALDPGNPSIVIGGTTTVTFTDYRWHVTSYGKDSAYSQSFNNGIFTLNSNFEEADLHWNGPGNSAGSEDLVILVGVDSSGLSTTPDRFLFVSGNTATYKTRQAPTTYNFNTTESSKNIQWSKGSLSYTVKKVWLFVGYKNTSNGKNLRMTNIGFSI